MEGHARFGRFRAVERLGSGSMGVVYRAVDPEIDHEVALKTLRAGSADDIYRLKREFRALSQIAHPNLVELYELFADADTCFFTMELVRGRPCTEYLWRGRTPEPGVESERGALRRLERISRQLVSALEAVHDAEHVHRDVKPSNVLVSPEGRLVVLDFGLAGVLESKDWMPTERGVVSGTLPYMAPEQLAGDAPRPAMDWYATGVLLFELLAGRLPFEGTMAETVVAKQERRLEIDLVPEGFRPLVLGLLEPRPDERATGTDILSTFESLTGAETPPLPSPTHAEIFCGRATELAELRRLHDTVGPEQPAAVRVVGPSGIGKTRLLEHFLESVRGDTVVLRGRCHPKESLPYKALDQVIDELSRYLLTLPEGVAATLAPRHVTALVRLFPVLGRVPALSNAAMPEKVSEPKELRRRGIAALRELLARISDRARVAIWIDDAQWGDEDSGQLLTDVLRPPDAPGLLVLLSRRAQHPGESQALDRLPAIELPLGPLPRPAVEELASLLIGADRAPGEAAQIAIESEGSPFLVCELASHLRSDARPVDTDSARTRLAQLTLERAETLPDEARDVLDLVSIAAGPVEMAVVLAAARNSQAARNVISLLSRQFLVHETVLNRQPALEPVHDRIREAITAQMAPGHARECHERMALALEDSPTPEPEALAHHFHQAGHDARAAEYAVSAGDRAANALAFLRAAEHYAAALSWKSNDRGWRRPIERRRADALANAGHSAEAAEIYLSCAHEAPPLDNLDLRRLAFKHFFASGRFDEGIEVLRPLLGELELPYPTTTAGVALRTLWYVAQAALRAPAAPTVSVEAAPTPDLFRIDVCDAASSGLVPMDPLRGVYFLFLGLAVARAHGEPQRYGKLLAGAGGSLMLFGPRALETRGARMLRVAETIAAEHSDALVTGFVAGARGQVALAHGDWAEALKQNGSAADLEQSRAGLTFERNIAQMAALRALEELGHVQEFTRRAEELRRDAERAGDGYGEATARLNLALIHLMHDEPEEARAIAEDVLGRWSQRGFHIQHLYAHRVLVHADLYEGNHDEADRRLRSFRSALDASGLLYVPLPRLDSALLAARVRLAKAAAEGAPPRGRSWTRLLDRIGRERRADSGPHRLSFEAAVLGIGGNHDEADRRRVEAARSFTDLGMELCAIQARCGLSGSDRDEAMAELRERGVAAPERWLRFQAPGSAPR